MIAWSSVLTAALLALGGGFVHQTPDARLARRRATWVALASLFVVTAGIATPNDWLGAHAAWARWLPAGGLHLAPIVASAVAVVAVALAPIASHPPGTLARMLWLFAISEAFLATTHGGALAILWALSVGVTWKELRNHRGTDATRRGARVFGIYQLGSALFFAAATLLFGVAPATATALLLVAIGIREAVIPAHSWFPRFVQTAPMGVVVAFAGPQLGVCAKVQLLAASPLPGLAVPIAAMGATTAVVAAMLGVAQRSPRRALAYFLMSQTGLIAFGLESASAVGMVGALTQWHVLALSTTGFAMCLAAVEARRGSVTFDGPNGTFDASPRLAVAYLVFGFASVGFPLTLGFVGEDLLLQGTVEQFPWLGFALVVATALNGIHVMRGFIYLFTGSTTQRTRMDLTRSDTIVLGAAMMVLFVFGIAPALWLGAP